MACFKSPFKALTRASARVIIGLLFSFCLGCLGSTGWASTPESAPTLMQQLENNVDRTFETLNEYFVPVVFFDVPLFIPGENGEPMGIPLIVFVLIVGCVGFSCYFKFINLRMFGHAINVVRGQYDNKNDVGEISSFQALSSALSATVGLGNIAGVAVAMSLGGAGAVFWMWIMAFFGMCMKFTECSFGVMYRKVGDSGHVLGGPMIYLRDGFIERFGAQSPMAVLGKFLSLFFAVCVILGSLGGGNLFQSNQSYQLVAEQIPFFESYPLAYGLLIAVLCGAVIIGGIQRIGSITSKLVPGMCVFYCAICLYIILSNYSLVPSLFATIFTEAFSPQAGLGGVVGVMIAGIKRAAFSNEAGLGSSAIAHSAAKTNEPVREGLVAMLEPFIDTLVVCTMTALAILVTNAHIASAEGGVAITSYAFASVHPHLPKFLTVAVVVFAFSTLISWSYYGERAAEFLGGQNAILPFKLLFVVFAGFAPLVGLKNAITFSEIMILILAFSNIFGLLFLAPKLKAVTSDYLHRFNTGKMPKTL